MLAAAPGRWEALPSLLAPSAGLLRRAGLGATLDLAGHATAPDTASLRRRLVDRKRRLTRHSSALHKVHEPWGLSAYDVQSALLGIPARARGSARLAAPEITPELADRVRDDLREFAHLGGFTLRPGGSPWLGAALHDREQAREGRRPGGPAVHPDAGRG